MPDQCEQAAREIVEEIDFGDLSECQVRRLLTREEMANSPLTDHYAMAQRKVVDNHVESIAAILRKHFGPGEARIIDHDGGIFTVDRRVIARYGGRESLNQDGKWCGPGSGANTLFESRAAAEAALKKASNHALIRELLGAEQIDAEAKAGEG